MIYKMFTLVSEKSKYVRVRRGVELTDLEKELKAPVKEVFAGEIVPRGEEMLLYVAKPLENYAVIARKFGVGESELKDANFARPVYPTCRLYVPKKRV